MTTRSTAVLVCGAGASGLTLAIELARRGVDFRLVDKSPAPFTGSRGKGIQPRTLEVFEDLGVADRIAAAGGHYPPVRFYAPDGGHEDRHIMSVAEPTTSEPYRRPFMVPQWATEGVLRARLAELGHRVHAATEVLSFEQDGSGVTAQLVHDGVREVVHAQYLVGVDGGRSSIRRALGVDFDGVTLPISTVIADVELDHLSDDLWHRWGDGDRQVMITPLRGTDLFQILAPVADGDEPDLSAAGLTALVAARTGHSDIPIRAVHWASVFGTNERVASRFRVGRVLLAGDAAHVHPATGGLGLNTSVQDAYNLGWRLAARLAGADEHVLADYEAERRGAAVGVVSTASRLLTDQREATGAPSLTRSREVHQLDLTYRHLVPHLNHGRAGRRLLAGDRAPDARVVGAAGQPQRLFATFWGTHWTMLSHDSTRPPGWRDRRGVRLVRTGQGGEFLDAHGDVATGYDLEPGDWVLVRPDGYVGATGSSGHIGEAETVLAAVGLAGPT